MTNQAGNAGTQPHRAAQTDIPEITIGTRITNFGVYDITVSGMASGGMGLVAWGPNRGRGGKMLAIKLPKPDRLAAASSDQRAAILQDFEREALTWCHLWYHPCIVAADGLLRLRALGNLPAIFIQYAPNGSLRDLLQQVHRSGSAQALGLEGVFAWGQMIASALTAIHQPASDLERPNPLAHCDLKPENVLLNAKGWALLTDLGLTRALASLADTSSLQSAAAMVSGGRESSGHDTSGAASELTAEQQTQVEQLRRLLAEAGITPPATAHASASEGALYATRTICVSPAQQEALTAALASSQQPDSLAQSALPVLLPSATAAIVRMGSRGQVAGTPPYMAPEQWLGLDAVVPASDIYALGVMLFELFAGVSGRAAYPHIPDPALAVTAGPFAAWCVAHANGPSRHLGDPELCALSDGPLVKLWQEGRQQQAEAVLSGLDALIGECLNVSPDSRPTAQEVRERLAALAAQAGLAPTEIPAIPRTAENEAVFWSNLGATYGEIGQPEENLRMQRKTLTLFPDDPQAYETLGNALGKLAQAEQQASEETAAKGDRAGAQRFGMQARAHGEEAVRTYQDAERLLTAEYLTRYPHLAISIPFNMGTVLLDLERYAEAVAARQRALAVDPNNAMSYRNLALTNLRWSRAAETPAALKVERLEQAETQMQRALAIAPHYDGGQTLLATIQRELAAARRA